MGSADKRQSHGLGSPDSKRVTWHAGRNSAPTAGEIPARHMEPCYWDGLRKRDSYRADALLRNWPNACRLTACDFPLLVPFPSFRASVCGSCIASGISFRSTLFKILPVPGVVMIALLSCCDGTTRRAFPVGFFLRTLTATEALFLENAIQSQVDPCHVLWSPRSRAKSRRLAVAE